MLAVRSRQALWCVVWQGGGIQNTLVLLSGLEAVVRPTGVSHGSVKSPAPCPDKATGQVDLESSATQRPCLEVGRWSLEPTAQ